MLSTQCTVTDPNLVTFGHYQRLRIKLKILKLHSGMDIGTHWRSHGTAECLLVMFLFVGEEAGFQDEL